MCSFQSVRSFWSEVNLNLNIYVEQGCWFLKCERMWVFLRGRMLVSESSAVRRKSAWQK